MNRKILTQKTIDHVVNYLNEKRPSKFIQTSLLISSATLSRIRNISYNEEKNVYISYNIKDHSQFRKSHENNEIKKNRLNHSHVKNMIFYKNDSDMSDNLEKSEADEPLKIKETNLRFDANPKPNKLVHQSHVKLLTEIIMATSINEPKHDHEWLFNFLTSLFGEIRVKSIQTLVYSKICSSNPNFSNIAKILSTHEQRFFPLFIHLNHLEFLINV
ncbi:hypothetical protein A3Q56_06943 [Intoshia linei]|uniref:Uncharacterized protein n=1 Tax=Intoshia linei TaxID=1819745 RepID=A0A177AV02_9BILA|nr:hypothetical protein A3Q56_06943 [Intoshia linei]